GRRSVGRRSRAPARRWPWASFFRPYRALRGTGGILPPDFSKNVQSPEPAEQAASGVEVL
ncbi:MAG TPA: hypothetical protein VMW38_16435, partial [Terriglobia bacterium]|nr:hypothetical protein [Terriglobia bacterium]